MKNKGRSAKELETRCTELEKQVQYYKSIAEEAGRNRLREIEQLNRQITDRKKTEEKLRESDKKIRSWLEYSPVCTQVLDRHFHMQYMSSAGINCRQLKDITKFYGKKFPFDCYPEPTRTDIVNNLKKIRETGEIVALETPVFDMAGDKLWYHSTFVPVTDKEGRCDYIIVVSINTTDQKRAEEAQANLEKQLRQARTIEAIGLMAGGVAHDLNNILAGIVGYPEIILDALPDDSDLREPVIAIQESGKRAATVVADLLTITRGVATTREDHDLNTIITEYLKSPECKKLEVFHPNVIFQDRLNARQAYIYCSPVHIKKCLMNLLTNAAEAISDNGTIHISTSNQYLDTQIAAEHNLKTGDYIVLNVTDTGTGISENELEHIFEPFYTRKKMGKSGTGLGLTVVWNTVQEHEGSISVESTDAGTCFQLYFPLAVEQKGVQENCNTVEEKTGQKEHILVVDDDPQILDLATRMLNRLGYTVNSVSSGEQAVQFIKEQSVDLILLDMLMEPGMNGYQTYKKITKHHPSQKAIIASGFSENNDVKAAILLGAHGFIKKPYSMDQLASAVRKALMPYPSRGH